MKEISNWMSIGLSVLVCLCLLPSASYSGEIQTNQQEIQMLDSLERKIEKLNQDYLILRQKGPEAFIKAQGLNLSPEDKKVLMDDLMKVYRSPQEPPYVSLDRASKTLIIVDHKGKTRIDISEFQKRRLGLSNGKALNLDSVATYSDLRNYFKAPQ